jgi:Txe/YoeB family toxin of Txe-Axe toxin-antitoxin module
MSYELAFTTTAIEDISFLKKSDRLSYKKLEKVLLELKEHPKTGKPQLRKYNLSGFYSRRISHKHRLVLILIFFSLVINSSSSLAQNKLNNSFKGTVKNSKSMPVPDVTVILKDALSGHMVKNSLSNQDGTFTIAAPTGRYVLLVSYLNVVAYQSKTINLTEDVDLGIIEIDTDSRNLMEVVIKSVISKPLIQIQGRKLVYNVENSSTSQGTNALEALKKTPGIIVNQDNTVTINGASGALVTVNGRQPICRRKNLLNYSSPWPHRI